MGMFDGDGFSFGGVEGHTIQFGDGPEITIRSVAHLVRVLHASGKFSKAELTSIMEGRVANVERFLGRARADNDAELAADLERNAEASRQALAEARGLPD